jgi:hypothetical protein
MELCRLGSVLRSMVQVPLGAVCMVGRQLMVSGFVMRSGFAMVPSRVIVMFCRLVVVFCRLLGHESSSSRWCQLSFVDWTGRT